MEYMTEEMKTGLPEAVQFSMFKTVGGQWALDGSSTSKEVFMGSCLRGGEAVTDFIAQWGGEVTSKGGKFVPLEVGGYYTPTEVTIDGWTFVFSH